MNTPRILVIQPDAVAGVDRFGEWLTNRSVTLEFVRPFLGDAIPTTVDAEGLLVLGGKMSSLDDEGHEWLADIRQLFLAADEQQVPTLGICLGAQLLSQARGGEVARGQRGPEVGAVRVQLHHDDDPLLGGLGSELLAAEFHEDSIVRLPDGAQLLASSEQYVHQAFRVGEVTWGVQFHPEVSPSSFEGWVEGASAFAPRAVLNAARADVSANDAQISHSVSQIADRFAEMVIDHASRALSR